MLRVVKCLVLFDVCRLLLLVVRRWLFSVLCGVVCILVAMCWLGPCVRRLLLVGCCLLCVLFVGCCSLIVVRCCLMCAGWRYSVAVV